MIRIFLASILLMVGLAGCNLVKASGGGITSAPTNDMQIIRPTAEATDEGASTSIAIVPQTAEATDEGTSTPIAIVPIPVSSIQIKGVPYKAYQIPGDPFRFVCQEPCPLDLQYIYAEYAGFRLAHAKLIELTGVDTLTELQPVDMHLVFEDSICSEFPYGHGWTRILPHHRGEDPDGGSARWSIFSSSRIHAHDLLWEDLREGREFPGLLCGVFPRFCSTASLLCHRDCGPCRILFLPQPTSFQGGLSLMVDL
jgi:hypothetical protein